MIKANQIISRFRSTYPEADPLLVQQLLTEAHQDISSQLALYVDEVDMHVVAGTKEYAFDATSTWYDRDAATGFDMTVCQRIQQVHWVNAGGTRPLDPVTREWLDQMYPYWMSQTSTSGIEPRWFYIVSTGDVQSVGLYPAPGESTSGSGSAAYPRATISILKDAVITGDSVLPAIVGSMNAHLYEMCFRYSVLMNPERTQYWDQMRTQALSDLSDNVNRVARYSNPSVKTSYARRRHSVV